jgi:hypothetical protein
VSQRTFIDWTQPVNRSQLSSLDVDIKEKVFIHGNTNGTGIRILVIKGLLRHLASRMCFSLS